MPDTRESERRGVKILWHSNAPWWPTGYGCQTALTVPKLRDLGHDVAVSAFSGLEGQALVIDGLTVYPKSVDGFGNDSIHAHAHHHFGGRLEDGLILTLLDVWVLRPELFRAPVRSAAWVPVDHEPAPPGVLGFFEQSDCIPIAMSQFGVEQLAAHDPVYVPHAIDTSVLYPRDRAQARARLNVPEDRFLVGMVAANKGNPSRKSFDQALQAFAEFQRKHKDAMIYLHTEATGMMGGVALPRLLAALDIPPESVIFPDQHKLLCTGLGGDFMAHAYSAMDVLMNPASGEGFGIPVLESQACGTPVIVSDFSAMREIGQVGWQVGGQKWWTPLQSWQLWPDVRQIVDSLNQAYDHAGRLRDQAVEFAQQYEIGRVMTEHWAPALEAIEQRLQEREPVAVVA